MWTTIWIVNGIIQSILKRGIEPFIISFIIMLMPYIVQAIIKGLDGLDDRWRVKQCLEKERKKDIENSCAYRQQGAYRGHYHQKSKFPFQGVRFFHFIYPQGKFLCYKFIIGKAFETCNQFSPKKAIKSRNIYSISPKYRVYCYCLKEQGQGFYMTAF